MFSTLRIITTFYVVVVSEWNNIIVIIIMLKNGQTSTLKRTTSSSQSAEELLKDPLKEGSQVWLVSSVNSSWLFSPNLSSLPSTPSTPGTRSQTLLTRKVTRTPQHKDKEKFTIPPPQSVSPSKELPRFSRDGQTKPMSSPIPVRTLARYGLVKLVRLCSFNLSNYFSFYLVMLCQEHGGLQEKEHPTGEGSVTTASVLIGKFFLIDLTEVLSFLNLMTNAFET